MILIGRGSRARASSTRYYNLLIDDINRPWLSCSCFFYQVLQSRPINRCYRLSYYINRPWLSCSRVFFSTSTSSIPLSLSYLSLPPLFHQYFRCYSPVAFGKKYDPDGVMIRKYLPQLKRMPKKYIFEPWTAPVGVQKDAGCIIGTDYPAPIVDHKTVCKVNMEKMKSAYAAHKAAAGGAKAGGGGGAGGGKAKAKAKGKRPQASGGGSKGALGGAAAGAPKKRQKTLLE
jgi:hypothetical protein